jgi:hypothetical protein
VCGCVRTRVHLNTGRKFVDAGVVSTRVRIVGQRSPVPAGHHKFTAVAGAIIVNSCVGVRVEEMGVCGCARVL